MRGSRQISKHVSYKEATKSITAIKHGLDNTPNAETLCNMKNVSNSIFEKVRARYCVPIAVTSFYRSPGVNKLLGGAANSQHCTGEAMDLDADVYGMITNRDIFNYIKDNLVFDQLIWEYGDSEEPDWVHVSLKQSVGNRKQILVAYKERKWGRTVTKYKPYED